MSRHGRPALGYHLHHALFVWCLCLGTSSQTSTLYAQESGSLRLGMRVRLTRPDQTPERIVGTVIAVYPSSMTVQTSRAPMTVRRETIQKVEISERRSSKKKGALIGAGLGVLAVVVATAAVRGDESCLFVDPCSPGKETALVSAVLFVPLGVGLGAAIAPGERWVPAKSPTLRTGHTHSRGGVQVGFSIRF